MSEIYPKVTPEGAAKMLEDFQRAALELHEKIRPASEEGSDHWADAWRYALTTTVAHAPWLVGDYYRVGFFDNVDATLGAAGGRLMSATPGKPLHFDCLVTNVVMEGTVHTLRLCKVYDAQWLATIPAADIGLVHCLKKSYVGIVRFDLRVADKYLHARVGAPAAVAPAEPKCGCGSGSNLLGPGHSYYCDCLRIDQ